jgi:predicted dehydrogenase
MIESVVRVGLAGLGTFGRQHANVLAGLEGVELAAICDPRPESVAWVAERYNVPGRYADFDEMIADEPLDAVYIVSPEPTHAEMELAAFERGLAVFVEKPLAMNYEEGQRVVDAAIRAGSVFQVGFVLRFDPHHAYLQQQINSGAFGQLVSLRAKRNITRTWFADYGHRVHPVHETLVHDIDLMLWMTRAPCSVVHAIERSFTGHANPDAVFATVEFASGAVGLLECSWFVPERAPANVVAEGWHGTIDGVLEVVGTQKSAQLSMVESGLRVWSDERVEVPEATLWPTLHNRVGGALRESSAHFIDRVRGRNVPEVTSIEDALEGLRIADLIIAAAQQ